MINGFQDFYLMVKARLRPCSAKLSPGLLSPLVHPAAEGGIIRNVLTNFYSKVKAITRPCSANSFPGSHPR